MAIALSEAGASNRRSPAQNRRHLQHTKAGGGDQPTRATLYDQAKRANIPGRSRMRKAELQKALSQRA